MADLIPENQFLFQKWRDSGLSGEDFLKKPGIGKVYGDSGYQFNPTEGNFYHPEAHLLNVDPNTIESPALRNKALALQGIARLTGAQSDIRPGAQSNETRASDPSIFSNFGGGAFKSGSSLTPESTWRATFGPKPAGSSVVFDPVKDLKDSHAANDAYFNRPIDKAFYARYATPGSEGAARTDYVRAPASTGGVPANPAGSGPAYKQIPDVSPGGYYRPPSTADKEEAPYPSFLEQRAAHTRAVANAELNLRADNILNGGSGQYKDPRAAAAWWTRRLQGGG